MDKKLKENEKNNWKKNLETFVTKFKKYKPSNDKSRKKQSPQYNELNL